MAARQAISTLTKPASRLPAAIPTLVLHCHVKPGANKVREGITAVTDTAIEINIAAPAQDGKANRALIDILAQALVVRKSALEIIQGSKSRFKTVTCPGAAISPDGAVGDHLQAASLITQAKSLLELHTAR